MPLRSYGVLSARAVDVRREGAGERSPHYHVHLVDQVGRNYRAAVNVQSSEPPSELLYLVVDGFTHPVLDALPAARSGWTALGGGPRAGGLDFVRGNLFDPAAMRPITADAPGPDNDLADLFDHHIRRAIDEPGATVYVFGERWGPESSAADSVFGFLPGNGVHDIHMNQGNVARFRADDGVWQDGAVLVRLASRWVAVFLAFQSQSWHTDDTTGHAIEGPGRAEADVRIVAATVNAAGPAPERETVVIVNTTPRAVDLRGWRLADRSKASCPLPWVELEPGRPLVVEVMPPVALSNKGGAITLLHPTGLKVHGVAYTGEQVRRDGWTIVF